MGCLQSKEKHSTVSRTSLSLTYDTTSPLTSSLLDATRDSDRERPYSQPSSQQSNSVRATLVTDSDALITAVNYCRDHSPFQWGDEALPHIGSRELKWHYVVLGEDINATSNKKRKKVPMVMTLCHLRGQDTGVRYTSGEYLIPLTNPVTFEVFRSLLCRGGGLDHPYITPLEDVEYMCDKYTLVATRKWAAGGSLRDIIYSKQRPKKPFIQKYSRENGRPLSFEQIQLYGRHILEGLNALNSKGIIVDCLKSGNVLVFDKIARISDLENTILGGGASVEIVEMLMYGCALLIERDVKPCPFDVQLFGLVLLEMSTGCPVLPVCFSQEVEDQFCERTFPSCSSTDDRDKLNMLRAVLSDIFVSHEASVEGLLSSPLFANVQLTIPTARLKFSSSEKGLIKSAMKASLEARNTVLERIQTEREGEEKERQQRIRDLEEAALAASGTVDPMTDHGNSRRVQVLKRQSVNSKRRSSGISTTPSAHVDVSNKKNENDQSLCELSTATDNTQTSVEKNVEKDSSSSNVPDKYQKFLNIGLHQDQVKHKMIQDGFDPTTIGW